MKETLKNGSLDNKEASKEINAASIEVDVDVNGKNEKWLLMFKNETHNHPTEMEPFGGAGTCLGGAIRDPLSGRAFVYQAMRITGAGDPTQDFEKTLTGKLPQRKITRGAMEGYSDYGNQIGVAAGYINEFYHPGFIAKRMELGALVAAAPKDWVFRGTAQPESSGKLLKIILNNPYVKEAIHNHLYSQDGLILGIGESFNGLIKSGLIEKGEICDIESPSFYISHNISGEFLSTMADIEVVSNLSPWMMDMDLGNVYTSPLATREGRILLLDNGDDLLNSGQIATQFAKENITGSQLGIESLTSPDGRVLGTISSIDRLGMGLYKNVDIKAIPNIFKAGVKYFK